MQVQEQAQPQQIQAQAQPQQVQEQALWLQLPLV
jgi:hypothetical protein